MRLHTVFAVLGLACAAVAATSIFRRVPAPAPHSSAGSLNFLNAISAVSANDMWAVGNQAVHWDGSRWTSLPAPNLDGSVTNVLLSVAAVSSGNAWAVGMFSPDGIHSMPMAQHWDGSAWSLANTAQFAGDQGAFLSAITAISSSDIWAVGSLTHASGREEPLFEHFDGVTWSQIAGPPTGVPAASLSAISAVSSSDIWAVGSAIAEHWDGTSWTIVPIQPAGTDDQFFGVQAVASNDVWAVGRFTPNDPRFMPGSTLTLIEHWDGTSWTHIKSPNGFVNSFPDNLLYGATAVSANDIWAFGFYAIERSSTEKFRSLVLHWDGHSWTQVAVPNPATGAESLNYLSGGVAPRAGDLWLVGGTNEPSTGAADALILHTTGG